MRIRFHPAASAELEEAVREGARYGDSVALRLRSEVVRALQVLRNTPAIGEPVSPLCRCLPLRRFPFALVYLVTQDGLVIVAVAHSRKKPGYWARREAR